MKLKKLLPLFLLSTMLVACGGGDAKDDEKKDDEKQDPTPTPTPDPDPKPDPDPEPPVTEVTYYLAGSFNGWTAKDENYTLTADPANAKHFFFEGLELHEGDELKVTDSKGNWHPDGMGNNTVAEADGVYTVNLNLDQDPLISLEKTGDIEPGPGPGPQPAPTWSEQFKEFSAEHLYGEDTIPYFIQEEFGELEFEFDAENSQIIIEGGTVETIEPFVAAAGILAEAGFADEEFNAEEPALPLQFEKNLTTEAGERTLRVFMNAYDEDDYKALPGAFYCAIYDPYFYNWEDADIEVMLEYAFDLVGETGIPAVEGGRYNYEELYYAYMYMAYGITDTFTFTVDKLPAGYADDYAKTFSEAWAVQLVEDEEESYYLAVNSTNNLNVAFAQEEDAMVFEIFLHVEVEGNGWDLAAEELAKYFEEDIPAYEGEGTIDADYIDYIGYYFENYGYSFVYFDNADEEDALGYLEALDEAGWDVYDGIAISPEATIKIKYDVYSTYIKLYFFDISEVTYPAYVVTVANQGLDMSEYVFSLDTGVYFYDMYVDAEDSAVAYTLNLLKGMLVQNLGVEIVTDITLTENGYYMLKVMGGSYTVTVYGVPSNGLIEIQIQEFVPAPETGFVATVEAAFGIEEGTLTWDSHYMEFWAHWETTYTDKEALAEYLVGVLEGLGLTEDPEESAPDYDWYYYAGEEGYVSVYVYDNDTEGLWIEVSVGLYEEEPVEPSDKPEAVLALEEALYVEFELQEDGSYKGIDNEIYVPEGTSVEAIGNFFTYIVSSLQEIGYDYIEGLEGLQYDADYDIYYVYLIDANENFISIALNPDEVNGGYSQLVYIYVPYAE